MNERKQQNYTKLIKVFDSNDFNHLTDENIRYLKWLANYDNDTITNFINMFNVLKQER